SREDGQDNGIRERRRVGWRRSDAATGFFLKGGREIHVRGRKNVRLARSRGRMKKRSKLGVFATWRELGCSWARAEGRREGAPAKLMEVGYEEKGEREGKRPLSCELFPVVEIRGLVFAKSNELKEGRCGKYCLLWFSGRGK
ncbi:hypothetical protein HAX54_009483, partial [Datura stramonium]|nr:hypothetical protein [Datura stramonium]